MLGGTFTVWREAFTSVREWDGNTSTEFIDEYLPYIRTPSFLQKSQREIDSNPGFYQQPQTFCDIERIPHSAKMLSMRSLQQLPLVLIQGARIMCTASSRFRLK